MACVALVVVLGIVSGYLWQELRSARQQNVDQRRQLDQAVLSLAKLGPAPAQPTTIQLPAASPVAVVSGVSEAPVPVVAEPVPPPISEVPESLSRANAYMRSERSATARALAWSSALNLSPDQSQALKTVTMDELRRETEESLQIESENGSGPMDAQTAARLRMETVNRQQATLVRIHELMKPQLTRDQSDRMRTMFETWLTRDMVRVRAAQEDAAASVN